MCIYIYIYIYTCVCMCIYIYIYIYKERGLYFALVQHLSNSWHRSWPCHYSTLRIHGTRQKYLHFARSYVLIFWTTAKYNSKIVPPRVRAHLLKPCWHKQFLFEHPFVMYWVVRLILRVAHYVALYFILLLLLLSLLLLYTILSSCYSSNPSYLMLLHRVPTGFCGGQRQHPGRRPPRSRPPILQYHVFKCAHVATRCYISLYYVATFLFMFCNILPYVATSHVFLWKFIRAPPKVAPLRSRPPPWVTRRDEKAFGCNWAVICSYPYPCPKKFYKLPGVLFCYKHLFYRLSWAWAWVWMSQPRYANLGGTKQGLATKETSAIISASSLVFHRLHSSAEIQIRKHFCRLSRLMHVCFPVFWLGFTFLRRDIHDFLTCSCSATIGNTQTVVTDGWTRQDVSRETPLCYDWATLGTT